MEGESHRCQVLHRQVRELVYKVFSYFKCEADTSMPVHDVAKAQDIYIYLSLCHQTLFMSVSTADTI
jgi:hypothetical protein